MSPALEYLLPESQRIDVTALGRQMAMAKKGLADRRAASWRVQG